MMALSVRQPRAQLLVLGEKAHEIRAWSTRYRGPVLIHASNAPPDPEMLANPRVVDRLAARGFKARELPRGAFVGRVELVGVSLVHGVPRAPVLMNQDTGDQCPVCDPLELELGHFRPGSFAWHIRRATAYKHPIACQGKSGLWIPGGAT